MTTWTFIGAGNMASSLIGGLLANGASANDIRAVDTSPEAGQRLQEHFGINVTASLANALPCDGLVVAVKPDIVEAVCRDIATCDPSPQPVVISVAAGVREISMRTWLPAGMPIVRCMPNTPALLGLGATALYANTDCSALHRRQAQTLLDSAGTTSWVDDEALLDAVTAVSGSGPAYFFYLIEHMANAGTGLGLPADLARTLAIETAFGAASMARQGDFSPAQLRRNVTSKGGTTAAALAVFDEKDFPDLIVRALQASHDRAVELGDEFSASA